MSKIDSNNSYNKEETDYLDNKSINNPDNEARNIYHSLNLSQSEKDRLDKAKKIITTEFANNNNNNNNCDTNNIEVLKKRIKVVFDFIEKKIFALLIVAVAIATIYYSNLFKVLVNDTRVNFNLLFLAFTGYLGSLSVIIYISMILPLIKKYENDNEWESDNEKVFPLLTVLIIVSMVLFSFATWNVYGIFSIFISTIIKFGVVFTFQFAPSGVLGNLFFITILGLIVFSSVFIEHDGYLQYRK